MNSSSRVNSSLRFAGGKCGKRADIFGDYLLFRTETSTHSFAKHPDVGRIQPEQVAKLRPGEKRRLRASTNIEAAALVDPRNRAMGFEMPVLSTLGRIGSLVNEICASKTVRYTTHISMKFEQ